jgi:spore coat polysaccharide biosynthesis protein SpsF
VKPRVVLIVQARMGSTRLPGKVLKPILGEPMLVRQLERLRRCRLVEHIVVATTNKTTDDAIAALVKLQPNVGLFRGSEEDVLERYAEAAYDAHADVVVRVTSDCPLIEPSVVDRCIEVILQQWDEIDYVSNCHHRTYPRGLDTEVVRAETLARAHAEATEFAEREHVTQFIWRRPNRFRMVDVCDSEDHSDLRWTVDTPEDLDLVRRIYEALYPVDSTFSYWAALELVARSPELQSINNHVQQKPYDK